MFYDNLPVWGFIGKVEEINWPEGAHRRAPVKKLYLFTHIHFDLAYNGDRVIEVGTQIEAAPGCCCRPWLLAGATACCPPGAPAGRRRGPASRSAPASAGPRARAPLPQAPAWTRDRCDASPARRAHGRALSAGAGRRWR
jgi:hypothetical protein